MERDLFDREKTLWERKKIRKHIVNEINELMDQRKKLAEQDLHQLTPQENQIRESKLQRLDAEIEDLKDEITLDVLESLEAFSEKLHPLTLALVILTGVLATLTVALLLGIHVP